MKLAAQLIVPAVLFAAAGIELPPGSHAIHPETPASAQQDSGSFTSSAVLIEPGVSVGSLKLGDTRERVQELFPKKYEDQEWENHCGTTFNWVDTENKIRGGNLFIRFKKGKIFQIDSATTRFHTAEDIAPLDSPEKVASAYRDLKAFTLLTAPVAALGDRPLIFWVDKKKGIAFTFAYYPAQHKRYLYQITVFVPGKTFCPQEETTDSPMWQEIRPYSLEPPAAMGVN
jgi:hypothetical protein